MRRNAVLALATLLLAGCGSMPSPSPSPASSSTATATAIAASSSAAPSSASTPSASPSASETAPPTPSESPIVPPSASPASTPPSAADFDLPATPITATINQAYNTTGDPFDPDDLAGVRPGQVTARWYVDDDRWVVQYDGLDPERSGPLCPGNSIQTSAGFEHVSNAPTGDGGCEAFDATLAAGPAGVRLCGDEVLYLTAIPADAEGILFASIETGYQVVGSVVGLTGSVDASGEAPPAIDLDDPACEAVPPRP